MPRAANAHAFVGVNWGSSAFRAYLIGSDGAVVDEYQSQAGILSLDKSGMIAVMDACAQRWPDASHYYASGMVGSNVGWCEVPYAETPAGTEDLLAVAARTEIGKVKATIIPGVACERALDGEPDVLRGEETELLGLAAGRIECSAVCLPGTHTKWAILDRGQIGDFVTSMSGEIYDRLTGQGLLASIVESEASVGLAFHDGVRVGSRGQLGLPALLFGARARVMRQELSRQDAGSYIRGLLIGSDVADAQTFFPSFGNETIFIVGNSALSQLYASALKAMNVETEIVDSRDACLRGFRLLHEAANG